MKTMKFNSKKEFAQAIIEHGKLYDESGNCYMFDLENYPKQPFRIIYSTGKHNVAINGLWDDYPNRIFTTKPPFEHFAPVWAWDNHFKFGRSLRFYDAKRKITFDSVNGKEGYGYENYETIEKPYPQWVIEAQQELKKIHGEEL